MRKRSSPLGLLVLWLSASSLLQIVGPGESDAQASVRRSAGSMNRSLDNRRSRSFGAPVRGHDSGLSGSRTSRAAASASSGDGSRASDGAGETGPGEDGGFDLESGAGAPGAIADPESRDPGERTLGRACIYGVRDEVLYRPPGGRCRGDIPATVDAEVRARGSDPSPHAAGHETPDADSPAPGSVPASPSAQPPAGRGASSPSPATQRSRGTCIYGSNDEVIYAPPGADCRR